MINHLVEQLGDENREKKIFIVSGGCSKGADRFAEDAVKILGDPDVQMLIFPAVLPGESAPKSRWEFAQRAYARNRLVAQNSKGGIFCLTHQDRTGGTENTILHALELKIPTFLVLEDGRVYLTEDGKLPTCPPVRELL